MEQKRPADIIQELLDYLWNGLGLEEKGWKRLKKGDFKKKMKNGLTYQIWFDRSRYNYIDYEIGHGNVEVGFSCIIKQGDDYLYSFRIEPTTGGSFFRMLTEDLRLNTGLLDTFLPLVKANYLDFIDRFEADPVEALQPVCAPFTEAEDYSWFIYVREQMVERYGTAEQMEEYRRQAELRGTPGHKAKNWMGSMLFHLSHANDVDQAWASSRTREELDQVVEPFVQAKRQTGQWTQEDEAGMTAAFTLAAMGSMSSFCWADTPPPIKISCGLKICTMPASPCAISSVHASSSASTVLSPASAAAKMARPSFHAGSFSCAARTRAVVAA